MAREATAGPLQPVCSAPRRNRGGAPVSAAERARLKARRQRAGILLVPFEIHRPSVEAALRDAGRVAAATSVSVEVLVDAVAEWMSEIVTSARSAAADPLRSSVRPGGSTDDVDRLAQAILRRIGGKAERILGDSVANA